MSSTCKTGAKKCNWRTLDRSRFYFERPALMQVKNGISSFDELHDRALRIEDQMCIDEF